MENAGKIHGFRVDKIKNGYWQVTYKCPDTKKWVIKRKFFAKSEELANLYAIENKEPIIKEYKENKVKRDTINTGIDFYQMLEDYYTENSKYLKDDSVNKKINLNDRQRNQYNGNIKNHFIPFLKERKINSIQEITSSVYSDLKIYLQGKLKTDKYVNNVLTPINRILQYHERNELIPKLPYGKGLGSVIENPNEENERYPLPTEYIKNILTTNLYGDWNEKEELLFHYLIGMIGLTTGMRNSEIARIQRQDIKHIKDIDIYILKAYNHKTEYYNNENEKYRKIPLHPFVVSFIKFYIKEKEETNKITIYPESYLFGIPKMDKNGKIIDGTLHSKRFERAIKDIYRRILVRQRYKKTGKLDEVVKIDDELLEKEMEKNHITFYSLRHTFQTLFALFRGLKGNETDDLINYFVGHKIGAMRAKYIHINKVDNITFYNSYGKNVIDMLNQYIFLSKEEKQAKKKSFENRYKKVFSENQHLLNDDGEIDADILIDKLFNKGVETKNKNTGDDDIFESI
jgi:integrase